jgi:ABC-type transporter Mla MlaB component
VGCGRQVAQAAAGKTPVLRITTRLINGDVGLFIEGRLSGPCVSELEKCWQCAVAGQEPLPTIVDLTDVSFIDTHGKQLLAQMHEHGIKLVANGLMSKFIIDEIELNGPTKHLPTSL